MKHKVSELEGALLDAAVALVQGRLVTEVDEHPKQPGLYRKLRAEWGDHIVRWYAREGENADGPETDEEGGWEALRNWGSPSTDWSKGGPIVEREKISVLPSAPCWEAFHANDLSPRLKGAIGTFGPTPLIAAMRAYVASRLGEEVEIP